MLAIDILVLSYISKLQAFLKCALFLYSCDEKHYVHVPQFESVFPLPFFILLVGL